MPNGARADWQTIAIGRRQACAAGESRLDDGRAQEARPGFIIPRYVVPKSSSLGSCLHPGSKPSWRPHVLPRAGADPGGRKHAVCLCRVWPWEGAPFGGAIRRRAIRQARQSVHSRGPLAPPPRPCGASTFAHRVRAGCQRGTSGLSLRYGAGGLDVGHHTAPQAPAPRVLARGPSSMLRCVAGTPCQQSGSWDARAPHRTQESRVWLMN